VTACCRTGSWSSGTWPPALTAPRATDPSVGSQEPRTPGQRCRSSARLPRVRHHGIAVTDPSIMERWLSSGRYSATDSSGQPSLQGTYSWASTPSPWIDTDPAAARRPAPTPAGGDGRDGDQVQVELLMAHVEMPTGPRCRDPRIPLDTHESRATINRSQPCARSDEAGRLSSWHGRSVAIDNLQIGSASTFGHTGSDLTYARRSRRAACLLVGGGPAVLGLLGASPGQVTPVGGQGLAGGHVLGHIGQPPGRGPTSLGSQSRGWPA
jgi:hypothetical protein